MCRAHAPCLQGIIAAPLASRASGLVGDRGGKEGVLRTVSTQLSATSNIPRLIPELGVILPER